jgi:ABC-2 type transport system ATP-binding protein
MELTLTNISKNYENKPILQDISCTFTAGVYGLLGSNGSGKTTLFKITYNKQNIQQHAESYRSILGFLPQDFRYYDDFSGMKFMLYIAALKGLHHKTAKKRCQQLLSFVGLDEVKNKKIHKYSGGMKQRLGIAQALINDPEILILDEPTVGLDPKERVRFRNLLSSLSKYKIVLLSTHIVSDIEYIADEILVLKQGRFINRGTAANLLAEIQGCVWECAVDEKLAQQLYTNQTISNHKYSKNKVVLRIVAKEPPFKSAVSVVPTLEDLYLYYFREEEQK